MNLQNGFQEKCYPLTWREKRLGGAQQGGKGEQEGEEGKCRSYYMLLQSFALFYLTTYIEVPEKIKDKSLVN